MSPLCTVNSKRGREMDIETITLFMACLVFSGFSFFTNTKVYGESWLKVFTLILGLAGLAGAFYLLAASFQNYLAG